MGFKTKNKLYIGEEVPDMLVVDVGQLCACCGEDTAFGSGKFVNRVPADRDAVLELDGGKLEVTVEGYQCADCQMVECSVCDEMKLDFIIIGDVLVCLDCHVCDKDDHDDCELYLTPTEETN